MLADPRTGGGYTRRALLIVEVAFLLAVAKYDPLFEYLCKSSDGAVTMQFEDIERLVGPLPTSATKYSVWWANQSGLGSHVQAKAWLDAGREVESVDLGARRVRFSSARWRRGS